MALKDLIPPTTTPAAERPSGISCEKYLRSGGRRCAHYLANGACALATEFMCVEWIKLNDPDARRLPYPERPERLPRRP